jgi:hypothetical protein
MSGGALAANHYLISSTKQISPKVLKKLKGNVGARGPAGIPGAPGTPGAPGATGKEGAAATIPALTWHALTLEGGWVQYDTYYGAPSYTKDVNGFVHLSGAIDGAGKSSAVLATLPSGFRPKSEGIWVRAAATNNSADPHLVDIEIRANGEMEAEDSGTGANDEFVSLEGVTFYAG